MSLLLSVELELDIDMLEASVLPIFFIKYKSEEGAKKI